MRGCLEASLASSECQESPVNIATTCQVSSLFDSVSDFCNSKKRQCIFHKIEIGKRRNEYIFESHIKYKLAMITILTRIVGLYHRNSEEA